MPKINEDQRGLFVELWKESINGVQNKAKQISWMTISPGSFRGNHYHKNLYETFILIEGDCEAILTWPGSEEERQKYGWTGLVGEQKKLVPYEPLIIPPTCQHSFLSRAGAKVLILSSKEFDPENPDTFIYG